MSLTTWNWGNSTSPSLPGKVRSPASNTFLISGPIDKRKWCDFWKRALFSVVILQPRELLHTAVISIHVRKLKKNRTVSQHYDWERADFSLWLIGNHKCFEKEKKRNRKRKKLQAVCCREREREREVDYQCRDKKDRESRQSERNSCKSRGLCYERLIELYFCQHRLSNPLAHQQLQPTQGWQ